jgi:hypothetical protein
MEDREHDSKGLIELSRKKVEAALPLLIEEYLVELRTDGTVEDKRKAVSMFMDVAGMKETASKDPYAGLPMFNFNLASGKGGRFTIRSETPTGVQTLDIDLQPTASLLECVNLNDDLLLDD